jgi:hypothetical protein
MLAELVDDQAVRAVGEFRLDMAHSPLQRRRIEAATACASAETLGDADDRPVRQHRDVHVAWPGIRSLGVDLYGSDDSQSACTGPGCEVLQEEVGVAPPRSHRVCNLHSHHSSAASEGKELDQRTCRKVVGLGWKEHEPVHRRKPGYSAGMRGIRE